MQDKRPLLVLLLLVAVVGGAYYFVSMRDDSQTPTTETTATTQPSTYAPVATNEDLNQAVTRLVKIENELFENPNPDRVQEIMTTKCSCYADTRKRLVDLKTKGYKLDGPSLVLDRVSFVRATDSTMEGVVYLSAGKGKVVSSSGRTIEAPGSGKYEPLIYTLEKDQDGVWKVTDRSLPQEIVPR